MSLRTIMIFPKFENIGYIDRIRTLYDPLASLVRPHITLVFPFESPVTDEELREIMHNRLQLVRPFELCMHGISCHTDASGHYLFLNVQQGEEKLHAIHRSFYQHEFRDYEHSFPYVPHMTVGRLPDARQLNAAYEEVRAMTAVFHTVVDTVSVEMIGEHEESIIILEHRLG